VLLFLQLAVSLLLSSAGCIVWFSRGKGWVAIVCALLLILPKKWSQRGIALLLSAVLSFIMVKLNIMEMFPW